MATTTREYLQRIKKVTEPEKPELSNDGTRVRHISVTEVFGPTIQGEGALIGTPTVFIRTGGCDFQHCSWCDSLHAVLPEYAKTWKKYTVKELKEEVEKYTQGKPMMLTLSGGNPALQPFGQFLELMALSGYTFSIETQGSVAQDWFNHLDHLVLSPKPPSSGMVNDWDAVQECIDAIYKGRNPDDDLVSLKVVIMDEEDYKFAKQVHQKFPEIPFFLSVGNDNPPHYSKEDKNNHGSGQFIIDSIVKRTEWLLKRVAEDSLFWQPGVRITPQMHTLLWQNKARV